MSVYALNDLFWGYSEQSDRSFRRWVMILAIPFLVIGLVVPFLKLAGLEQGGGQAGEARYAELIQEEPAPIAEEVEEPAPAEEEQAEEPAPEEPAPTPETPVEQEAPPEVQQPSAAEQQQQARETAQRSGVLAFSDQLKDLRDSTLPGMDANRSLQTDVVTGGIGGGGAGNTIAQSASSGSGGIGSGQVRRQQGGTGIGERRTTTVDRPAGLGPDPTRIGQSGDARNPGRTLEEIQLVFDRNKGSLYTLYNRALRGNAGLRGVVNVKLTIAPNGRVSNCTVVSSELNDPELERKIVARIMLFDFGAKNVDEITIDYPITFQPL